MALCAGAQIDSAAVNMEEQHDSEAVRRRQEPKYLRNGRARYSNLHTFTHLRFLLLKFAGKIGFARPIQIQDRQYSPAHPPQTSIALLLQKPHSSRDAVFFFTHRANDSPRNSFPERIIMNQILQPGAKAPDFSLPSGPEHKLALADLRGKPFVLIFYPADFSPVCGDQLALLNEALDEFEDLGARLVAVSVDGVWCHKAYAESRKLKFTLLSDFEPKGAVARAFGVYRAEDGITERALFVGDADGVIRWSYLSPIDINPCAHGILHALEQLQQENKR